eukprot:TRINITY_DN45927_c0_g1_i1.p1 TRINITY_DN45927_c0_g1~~TRINITY_DN45927_c0_g1_i1.p1  ORF type:complete len:1227 (+),score=321.99 TRINITY_DN45927_c0_g1_i1:73-3681(+)
MRGSRAVGIAAVLFAAAVLFGPRPEPSELSGAGTEATARPLESAADEAAAEPLEAAQELLRALAQAGGAALLFVCMPLAKKLLRAVLRRRRPERGAARGSAASRLKDALVLCCAAAAGAAALGGVRSARLAAMRRAVATPHFVLGVWACDAALGWGEDASAASVLAAALATVLHLSDGGGEDAGGPSAGSPWAGWWGRVAVGAFLLCLFVLCDHVAGGYSRWKYRSRQHLTACSFRPAWLWYPTTLFDILAAYLYRVSTLAQLAVCAAQWEYFGQVRSVPPTLLFFSIELVQLMAEQVTLRRKQHRVNDAPVTVLAGPTEAVTRRGRLRLGQRVLLRPGESAPAALLLDSVVTERGNLLRAASGGGAPPIVINTAATDGETGDRVRYVGGGGPVPRETSSRRTLGRFVLHAAWEAVVWLVMGTVRHHGDGEVGDAHLAAHPGVVRQGARLVSAASAAVPDGVAVWGEVIGFARRAAPPRAPHLVDCWAQQVTQFFVFLAAAAAAVSALLGAALFGRPLDWGFAVQCALMVQVAVPMTLATMLATVLALIDPAHQGALLRVGHDGKKSLVAFAERQGAAAAAAPRAEQLRGVHLTDKTGTLTANEMVLTGCVPLGSPDPVRAAEQEHSPGAWDALYEAHMATTANTPQARRLEPEEAAYSEGLGVILQSIDHNEQSGWSTVTYLRPRSGKAAPAQVRRLRLGLSRRHRSVCSLVALQEPGTYRLVLQGSPEAAAGETGLQMCPAVLPSLPEAAGCARRLWERAGGGPFPDGAQRNWVYSWGPPLRLGPAEEALLAKCARELPPPEAAAARQHCDDWLRGASASLEPRWYMLLVDRWRSGVTQVPRFLASRHISMWMVTGDARGSASAIAAALGFPPARLYLSEQRSARALAEELAAECLPQTQPCTLLLSPEQQRLFAQWPRLVPWARAPCASVLRATDGGRPLIWVVCYASEADIKGAVVRACAELLRVPTVYSGDGKNDVHALAASHCGIAFPGHDGAPDAEVAAAASLHAAANFWEWYSTGELFDWALRARVLLACVAGLLLLKQSFTAGLNFGAATATGMTLLADPYRPVLYQAWQGMVLGLTAAVGVLGDPRELLADRPLLRLRTAATVGGSGALLGACTFAVCAGGPVDPEDLPRVSTGPLAISAAAFAAFCGLGLLRKRRRQRPAPPSPDRADASTSPRAHTPRRVTWAPLPAASP